MYQLTQEEVMEAEADLSPRKSVKLRTDASRTGALNPSLIVPCQSQNSTYMTVSHGYNRVKCRCREPFPLQSMSKLDLYTLHMSEKGLVKP